MIGKGNYDLKKVMEDFKKISDTQIEMMGSHPSSQVYGVLDVVASPIVEFNSSTVP